MRLEKLITEDIFGFSLYLWAIESGHPDVIFHSPIHIDPNTGELYCKFVPQEIECYLDKYFTEIF